LLFGGERGDVAVPARKVDERLVDHVTDLIKDLHISLALFVARDETPYGKEGVEAFEPDRHAVVGTVGGGGAGGGGGGGLYGSLSGCLALNIGDLRLELGKARRVAGHGRGHLLRRLRALELGDQLVLVGGHLLLLGLQTLDLGGEVFLPLVRVKEVEEHGARLVHSDESGLLALHFLLVLSLDFSRGLCLVSSAGHLLDEGVGGGSHLLSVLFHLEDLLDEVDVALKWEANLDVRVHRHVGAPNRGLGFALEHDKLAHFRLGGNVAGNLLHERRNLLITGDDVHGRLAFPCQT